MLLVLRFALSDVNKTAPAFFFFGSVFTCYIFFFLLSTFNLSVSVFKMDFLQTAYIWVLLFYLCEISLPFNYRYMSQGSTRGGELIRNICEQIYCKELAYANVGRGGQVWNFRGGGQGGQAGLSGTSWSGCLAEFLLHQGSLNSAPKGLSTDWARPTKKKKSHLLTVIW